MRLAKNRERWLVRCGLECVEKGSSIFISHLGLSASQGSAEFPAIGQATACRFSVKGVTVIEMDTLSYVWSTLSRLPIHVYNTYVHSRAYRNFELIRSPKKLAQQADYGSGFAARPRAKNPGCLFISFYTHTWCRDYESAFTISCNCD